MSLFRFVGFGLVSVVAACATSETVSENASSADVNGTLTEAGSSLSSNNAMLPHQRAVSILSTLQDSVSKDLPTNVNSQEQVVETLQNGVLQEVKLALLSLDGKTLETVFTENAQVAQLVAPSAASSTRTIDGVSEYEANPIETVFSSTLFEGYLSSFASAEHVSLDVHEADVSEDNATCKFSLT